MGKARYITCVTGNQAGKTILGREIQKYIAATKGNSNNCSIVLSSDFKAIKRNIISHMLAEWGGFIVKYDDVNHAMTLANGHMIYFFSSENVKSIEGATNCIFAWIDEGSDVPDEGYHRIRVRLMTLRGIRLITATAVLGVGVKQLEEEYKKGLNPEHCAESVPYHKRHLSFSWTSFDNPYLNQDELNELAKDIATNAEVQIRIYGKFENLGGRVFDRNLLNDKWLGYTREDIAGLTLNHYMLVDTASGQTENEKGDNTAIIIVGVAPGYGVYGRECIAGLMDVDTIEKTIIEKCRQYHVRKVGVEHIAAQTNYFLQSLRKNQLISDYFEIVPLKRVGGNNQKPARHGRLVPLVKSGRLKFPADGYGGFENGFDELVEEMRDTPYGRHDDRIDALCDIANKDFGVLEGFSTESPFVPEKVCNTLMAQSDYDSLYDTVDEDVYSLSLSVN